MDSDLAIESSGWCRCLRRCRRYWWCWWIACWGREGVRRTGVRLVRRVLRRLFLFELVLYLSMAAGSLLIKPPTQHHADTLQKRETQGSSGRGKGYRHVISGTY